MCGQFNLLISGALQSSNIFWSYIYRQILNFKQHKIAPLYLWYCWFGREIVDTYNTEIKRLAEKLLSLIAETLQLKHDFFAKKFGKPFQRMRMNYYPQCPRPDRVFGLSPHADMDGITLLLQDDEVVGLNVRKDDQWIAVQPNPYALVINVGNLIEVNRLIAFL